MTNQKFKNNPYNTNNKLISLDDISNILKNIILLNHPLILIFIGDF